MKKEKRSWKMWGAFYPHDQLVQVTFDKSELTKVFAGVFKTNPAAKKVIKIKRVTVIEGNYEARK